MTKHACDECGTEGPEMKNNERICFWLCDKCLLEHTVDICTCKPYCNAPCKGECGCKMCYNNRIFLSTDRG